MDKKSASLLIKDTFQQPFDKERFVHFVKNLVNDVDETKALVCQGQYIHEKFRDFVKKYERIGTYTDPSDQKVDILIVYLKNEGTLARARTSQRNFISTYLKSRDAKDAGLIAFVSPNPEDWRFSFVKMEYKLAEKKGKVRAEEEFTPARRYSFLVGRHESSHTAQQQLLPILSDDQHNPTLELIENAFKIEIVTEEFFEKYRDLFIEIKEALDVLIENSSALKKEFVTKNVDSADFSKKLLGQIVFLYFLQKKGWFGVERDAHWGSGHKNFLRQLFEGKLMKYKNFFNDVLEPLFYEALASDRSDNDHFYSKFDCRIPFLNGGLFDSINGYDWVNTDINLPNELFSNDAPTKEGDTGTGVLDVFDRYNFTVKEDEPLEKEVAIDPEMLGKVFEKLLPVNERNIKATFYTPREIVHYMCQESLINYLATELDGIASKEDIQLFIRMGETVIEHDARVIQRGEENSAYSFKLPESIRKNAEIIDQKLGTIRVCDPAIGSGAFPVGMMNEIVRARQTLTSYLPKSNDRLPYDLKRHAIQESLYGVDIDPGAVEIAKLRLWLSLIVDEDDIERIKPLPNLDYRIMQGNSLLEEFEGIRLFDDKLLESSVEDREKQLADAKKKIDDLQRVYIEQHSTGKLTDVRGKEIHAEIKKLQSLQKQLLEKPSVSENMGMFDAPSRAGEVLKELKSLHSAFFSATQRKKKDEIKKKIEALDWELIEISLTEKKKGELLEKLKRTRVRPFFLWKLHFADVFREKGGFDVVIANPPYGIVYDDNLKEVYHSCYPTFQRNNDIYIAFYERGIQIMREKGVLVFITPNTFLNGDYFKAFRSCLTAKTKIQEILNYGNIPIFDDPTVFVSVMLCVKNLNPNFPYNIKLSIARESISDLSSETITIGSVTDQPLKPQNIILKKILNFSDVKTVDDLFFVKDVGFNYWTEGKGKKRDGDSIGDRVLYSGEPENPKDIPFLKGRNIEKFSINEASNYLRHNYDSYLKTNDTFRFSEDFLSIRPKIVYRQTSNCIIAALDEDGRYLDKTVHLIVPRASETFGLKYLLGLLNSKLFSYLYTYISQESEGRTFAQVKTTYVKKFPVRILSQTADIEDKVQQAIERKTQGKDVALIESQIDRLVYEIYELTDEEIGILEASIA